MENLSVLNDFFDKSRRDPHLGPLHIALFSAILKCWNDQDNEGPIFTYAEKLRSLSKISSPTSFYRVIRELHDLKFIDYSPSRNHFRGSRIIITM